MIILGIKRTIYIERCMMGNYYGVREGIVPGVYETWADCQEQIKGYSGAVYKKFKTREEASKFINDGIKSYNIDDIDEDTEIIKDVKKERASIKRIDELEVKIGSLEDRIKKLEGLIWAKESEKIEVVEVIEKQEDLDKGYIEEEEDISQITMDLGPVENNIGKNEMIAYVDGSYRNDTKEYSYGMIIFTDELKEEYCEKYDDDLKSMRNVAGEIRGAEEAMKKALELGKDKLYLHYDYLGIEKWAKEDWKANKKGTQDYRDFYKTIRDKLEVDFVKVLAHSGDEYNDVADKLAKKALGIK